MSKKPKDIKNTYMSSEETSNIMKLLCHAEHRSVSNFIDCAVQNHIAFHNLSDALKLTTDEVCINAKKYFMAYMLAKELMKRFTYEELGNMFFGKKKNPQESPGSKAH